MDRLNHINLAVIPFVVFLGALLILAVCRLEAALRRGDNQEPEDKP